MKRGNIITIAIITVIGMLAAILGARLLVAMTAKGRTYSDISSIPHRKVGLLLGATPRLANGRINLFFSYRITAAAKLIRAGKIDYLIVSGDNHIAEYDEPTEMKQALLNLGVPAERIYCDYAGFRTLDSVVRAKEIFGQTNITVISQKFHNQRAIYIAQHKNIDAIGFNARDIRSCKGLRTRLREQFAMVKAVLDIWLREKPRFLGPPVEIGTAGVEK